MPERTKGPHGPNDPNTERRLRRAMAAEVAGVEADERLHRLVDRYRHQLPGVEAGRQRLRVLAAAVVVVVVAAGALVVATRDDGGDPDGQVRTSPSPTGLTNTAPAPTGPTAPSSTVDTGEPDGNDQGATGSWDTMAASPLGHRTVSNTASVWTGEELFVWGEAGFTGSGADNRSGALYDPDADRWRTIAEAPVHAMNGAAVWTGSEVVVGPARPLDRDPDDTSVLHYAAYDPAADRWRTIPGSVDGFGAQPAAWTGSELVLFASSYGAVELAVLDLDTGEQRPVPMPPPPAASSGTGQGGRYTGGSVITVIDGGRLALASDHHSTTLRVAISNPGLDGWTVVSDGEMPAGTTSLTWTGSELLVMSGTVAAYDPATDRWRDLAPLSSMPTDGEGLRRGAWTGSPTVWTGAQYLTGHGIYDLAEDRWFAPDPPTPDERSDPVVVWTGSSVLVWSGMRPCVYVDNTCPESPALYPDDGLVYRPR